MVRSRSREDEPMAEFVGAIDQGTTSTRFMVFNGEGTPIASRQLEHSQILPRPGWVEHDPLEIVERASTVVRGALASAKLDASDLAAIGITNQRETTVVWDRASGRPVTPAIVWQCRRTAGFCDALAASPAADAVTRKTGLVIGFLHDEFIHVPIELLASRRKSIDPAGPVWSGTLAATGQPERFG
jgi:glycerol kinase